MGSTQSRSRNHTILLAPVGAVVLSLIIASSVVRAETLVFFASASGKQTNDNREGGGNPFASALIEILARPSVKLSELPAALRQLTIEKSKGFQSPDVPTSIAEHSLSLVPPYGAQRRIALVLVVSDYNGSGGIESLPGAKYDSLRVASALTRVGFNTEVALDLGLQSMRERLAAFRARSIESDAAVVYTTGHGVEVAGTVYLMPGDYPVAERDRSLGEKALRLSEIADALRAKKINLVFYGGCRDDPF